MSTLKTTILLSALACLAMFSTAFAQDNVPVKAPESLKNVPFKIEGVEGFLHSLGIDPKTEIKLSRKNYGLSPNPTTTTRRPNIS